MQLNLKNPIIFLDIESTGLNIATDRIIELSLVKIKPCGDQEIKTRRLNRFLYRFLPWIRPRHVDLEIKTRRFNPTIPISPEAQRVHGISDDDVKDCPTFKSIAKSLASWMNGCDFAGYNSLKYDIPILAEEFLRAGVDFDFRKRLHVDVQNIFHKMEQRTLSAAYKFYCKKELVNAHSAEADTLATYEILQAQLDTYKDTLQNDISFLSEFSSNSKFLDYAGRIVLNEKDVPVFNFGKHKGRAVISVLDQEPSYYSWMMNGDFTLDTKKVLTELKLSMR